MEAIKAQNQQLLLENNEYKQRENQIEDMLDKERKRVDELKEELRRERTAAQQMKKMPISVERRSY